LRNFPNVKFSSEIAKPSMTPDDGMGVPEPGISLIGQETEVPDTVSREYERLQIDAFALG
jgi:hypothetical protein